MYPSRKHESTQFHSLKWSASGQVAETINDRAAPHGRSPRESKPMKIKSQKDFYSGLMFMAVGLAFAWGATTYTIGEGARMGAGYFPLMLGLLLAALGAFILFAAGVVGREDGEPIGAWVWRPRRFIIAANLLFGVLLGGLRS